MTFFKARKFLSALAATVVLTASVRAQTAPAAPKKELSETVQQAVQNLVKLQESPDSSEQLLAEIDKLLATAAPNSFDMAVLSQMKVQALLTKQDLVAAIAPLETAIRLSEAYDFFGERGNLELLWILAQLYAQDAGQDKDPKSQQAKNAKAYTALRRWLDKTPKSNPEAQLFAANILYNRALEDPQKVDMAIMKQAQLEAEKGLAMAIKPKEQLYVMLVAILQQQGDYPKSAEYLELLVRDYPENKTYWQQLLNAYLVQEEKGYLRAVVTLERAQQREFLTEKKDNFILVGLHANLKQYAQSADLLEAGLRNGKIDPEQKNWELLAQSYQQTRKDQKAIATLKEASKLFPKEGSLDQQIGYLYYQNDKFEDAFSYLKTAVAKGVSKPAQTHIFIAYLGLELKKLEDAKQAAEKAIELEPASKEAKRLLEAVDEAIAEREAQMKSAPATQKT